MRVYSQSRGAMRHFWNSRGGDGKQGRRGRSVGGFPDLESPRPPDRATFRRSPSPSVRQPG